MAKEKINFEDEQVRLRYRHTTSHILAQAVKKLWPDAKLAIGPAIENGFYYDFDMEHKLNDQDLLKIQKEMKKIIQANYPLERFELPREEAIKSPFTITSALSRIGNGPTAAPPASSPRKRAPRASLTRARTTR